ncbi:uncharacterized protein LOC144133794 [Amblyomma americanum]
MGAFAHVLEAVFPDWSEDQRTQVLAYLDLKGVRSVTDVEKINEEELADIIVLRVYEDGSRGRSHKQRGSSHSCRESVEIDAKLEITLLIRQDDRGCTGALRWLDDIVTEHFLNLVPDGFAFAS